MKDKICLMQLTEDELRELIKSSVQELINENKSNQQNKDLLTFKEVISLLGISASTLNSWKREGKIPYHKLNGRIYFKYGEITQSLTNAGNTKARVLREDCLVRGTYV